MIAGVLPDDAAAQDAPKFVLAWGGKGDQPGEFHSPISLAIDRNDDVYVTDLNNARVQKFTREGKYISGFDLPLDTPPRRSCIIGGMAVDGQGRLYLSFMVQHKVAIHTDDGKVVREWGKRGQEAGEFHQPGGIVLHDGSVFIADQCNHRVQKFTADGEFLAKWGQHG